MNRPRRPVTRRARRLNLEALEERKLLATDTWTGGGIDNNWSTGGNWSSGVPGTGETLVFPLGASQLTNVDNVANLSVAEIQFGGTHYVITGTDALTLTGSAGVGIDNQAVQTNSARPSRWALP